MGLFDRKYCSVCGSKISLLGNRKLEDGNLCKACAGKLSPWFSERRHSTLDEIRAQLAYREDNRAAVAAFRATRSFGTGTKLLIDEDARCFMVTGARDLAAANPAVIDCAAVTDCRLDVSENRWELKHPDKEGKRVSFIPPRYEYSYDFYCEIRVSHPYFDLIRFKLNSSRVETGQRSIRDMRPLHVPHGQSPKAAAVGAVLSAISGDPARAAGPTWNAEYNDYLAMGEEIRSLLMDIRQEARDEAAAVAAPKVAVTCPHCGAPTVPDENGCCEYCGSRVDDR